MDLSTVYKKPRKKAAPKRKKVPEAGLLLCQKDKLAIVATADPTRGQAPYDDKDYEIWALAVTTTFADVKRVDLVFEMHTDEYYERDMNVKQRLIETKTPIYMLEKHDDIPMSMAYPMNLITTEYRKYHTSSISFMLALAYHSFLTTGKPEVAEMYGVHMVCEEEYKDQRACCEYWIGLMEGAGMAVIPPAGGILLASVGLYGVENYNPVCWDMRQRIFGLQNGITDARNNMQEAKLQEARNFGALKEVELWNLRFQRGEYRSGSEHQEEGTEDMPSSMARPMDTSTDL